jgi:hypothetical protein
MCVSHISVNENAFWDVLTHHLLSSYPCCSETIAHHLEQWDAKDDLNLNQYESSLNT